MVIFTVDLQTFTVVARKASTDAAMANSRFKFVDDETILAAQGPSSSMKGVRTLTNEYIQPDVLVMNAVGAGSHDAALLDFPSFNMQSICHYQIEALTKPEGVASGSRDDPDTWWSPQGSGLIRAKSAEPACEPIFSAARVAAPAEMPGPMDASHPHAERQLGPSMPVRGHCADDGLGDVQLPHRPQRKRPRIPYSS